MDRKQLKAEQALAFIFAGKAVVTLQSAKTGTRYTYKVSKAEEKEGQAAQQPRYFVSLLTGPENTSDYTYLGMVSNGELRLTHASKLPIESAPVKAMQFALAHPEAPELEIFHEGRCGRCGRVLTVPESVETGFGPECAGKLQ